MERTGLIHIYCGSGKGKTTAAIGLALRAAGSGMRVHIVQLLKGGHTSELEALKLIPNITVSRLERNFGFTFHMTEDEKKEITACHDELLRTAISKMQEKQTDLLIIDEFFAAYDSALVDRRLADSLVFGKEKAASSFSRDVTPRKNSSQRRLCQRDKRRKASLQLGNLRT